MSNTPIKPIIKINGQEYKLKVTLGLYKRLSFPQTEIANIYNNIDKFIEVLKLAIFYGNKKDKGWANLKDMQQEITDDLIEDIDDGNFSERVCYIILGEAFSANLSDSLKEAIKKNQEAAPEDSEQSKNAKKN